LMRPWQAPLNKAPIKGGKEEQRERRGPQVGVRKAKIQSWSLKGKRNEFVSANVQRNEFVSANVQRNDFVSENVG
jgi:hypothetical protein